MDAELRKEIREAVRQELDALMKKGGRRLPVPLIARKTGIESSTLRMRARRAGIELRREGKHVTVSVADLSALVGEKADDVGA